MLALEMQFLSEFHTILGNATGAVYWAARSNATTSAIHVSSHTSNLPLVIGGLGPKITWDATRVGHHCDIRTCSGTRRTSSTTTATPSQKSLSRSRPRAALRHCSCPYVCKQSTPDVPLVDPTFTSNLPLLVSYRPSLHTPNPSTPGRPRGQRYYVINRCV